MSRRLLCSCKVAETKNLIRQSPLVFAKPLIILELIGAKPRGENLAHVGIRNPQRLAKLRYKGLWLVGVQRDAKILLIPGYSGQTLHAQNVEHRRRDILVVCIGRNISHSLFKQKTLFVSYMKTTAQKGWKKDAKPLKPHLLARHISRSLLGQPEINRVSWCCGMEIARNERALRPRAREVYFTFQPGSL